MAIVNFCPPVSRRWSTQRSLVSLTSQTMEDSSNDLEKSKELEGKDGDTNGTMNGGNGHSNGGTNNIVQLDPQVWSGFYKKSVKTRQDQLHLLFPRLEPATALPVGIADNMVENCIGTLSLPLGLGLNFKVNGKDFVVPMAVEEPSVIAALSGAAKTISDNGGFIASYSGNIMVSQIQLMDVTNPEETIQKILDSKQMLIENGNVFCRTMVNRGGGVKDITARTLPFNRSEFLKVHNSTEPLSNSLGDHMVVIHIHVDVCESMGANTVNTVAEGLAPYIVQLVGGRVGLKIVTNFCTDRRASASFRIPLEKLGYKKLSGPSLAERMLEGYAFAYQDSYRAVTHNKGIMNGVDAAAIAMGQDFRALEAAAHAWACRSGRYLPLTSYRLVKTANGVSFEGSIEIPVPIGVRGGAIQTHPTMKYTHELMSNPDCAVCTRSFFPRPHLALSAINDVPSYNQRLGEALAAVGLAQNFAALRALASEGIQRGHMALHARNIAIQAGASPDLVAEVAQNMVHRGRITIDAAREYLKSYSFLTEGTQHRFERKRVPPSTLIVDLELEVPVAINVVFESFGPTEHHLIIRDDPRLKVDPIQHKLFGEGRNANWFKTIFALLGRLRAHKTPQRDNLVLQFQLKLTSMLMNLLIYQLADLYPKETHRFLSGILAAALNPLGWLKKRKEIAILIGFPLVDALWNAFKNQVDQSVGVKSLSNALKEEQLRIFNSCIQSLSLSTMTNLDEFMATHARRWQALHFFFRLGHYLEWEGTIANDIGNAQRALDSGEPNAYTFWLSLTGRTHSKEAIETFLTESAGRNARRREKLLRDQNTVEFFDVSQFLEILPVVQKYVGISEIMLSAKL